MTLRSLNLLRCGGALALLVAALLPAEAAPKAQTCNWQASVSALPEPWSEATRTFANGDVRLAVLDTIEPAAGAFWLLLLSPPYDPLGARQCRVVGEGALGFAGLDFAALTAAYDPAIGLIFTLPVQVSDPQTGGVLPKSLRVTLNQATGNIGAAYQ